MAGLYKLTALSRAIGTEKPAHNGGALLPLLCYNKGMGNTVGSTSTDFCNFLSKTEDAYILGLWCADSYWWSSSVGLSNTDVDLIERFRKFLKRFFPESRIKSTQYHLFVNSRPLLREFVAGKKNVGKLKQPQIIRAYFAGRFDGDGSIDKNLRNDCRIVYSDREETKTDKILLRRIDINNVKIYHYKTANTFCLYVSRYDVKKFLRNILPYSSKLQKLVLVPRRDLDFREG